MFINGGSIQILSVLHAAIKNYVLTHFIKGVGFQVDAGIAMDQFRGFGAEKEKRQWSENAIVRFK